MDTISTGMLVWVSVQPLIRLWVNHDDPGLTLSLTPILISFLGVACGFAITKVGLFSPTAAIGAGQIVLVREPRCPPGDAS